MESVLSCSMPVIDCSGLSKAYTDHPVLDRIDLTVRSGEKVGVVGNNGCGKSTLGRLLAGLEEPDEGKIARRRGAKVDYLPQEPHLPDGKTVSQVVLASLTEWNRAKRRYDDLTAALAEAPTELDRLVAEQAVAGDEVDRLGGWERLHEAETIIGHLGIEDSSRRVETLSGGEQRRVALARLLIGAPDLAILDEPTNHLDVGTIEWLEEHLLKQFKGAVLLITHDRYVLDRVTTRTVEVESGALSSYDGGYSQYLEAKAERQLHAEKVERNRQNFLRKEVEWLRRQPKARTTKQKARIGRAQTALDVRGPKQEKVADLRFESERLGKTILELEGLTLERSGKRLIRDLDLALRKGERIGVVGPNGTGKTSLLLCLQGELDPTSGTATLGQNTRIGYLDQSRAGLDDTKTIRDAVAGDQTTVELAGEDLQVGAYLERFLFDYPAQRMKVGVLSGGERARVCLAKLLFQKTNLLLLDEPTNDLDVATLGALEAMLTEYGGSALIVSHDRWFLDRVVTSILAFEGGGQVDLHRGSYSDYRERRAAAIKAERRDDRSGGRSSDKKAASSGRPAKLSFAEERELEGLMERIDSAEAEVASLEAELGDPATYQAEGAGVAKLTVALEAARESAANLIARWEELETKKASLAE